MMALYRIMMMLAGYMLACIAASLVLALGMLGSDWNDLFAAFGLNSAHAQSTAMWILVGLGALIIFVVGFLPVALIVALTEGFALRSAIIYGVAGGALALASAFGLDFAGHIASPGTDVAHEQEVFAAAGIAGGLVYWLFAGRQAGVWK
jgi:hypothetical protein